jgi:hypothetical protein
MRPSPVEPETHELPIDRLVGCTGGAGLPMPVVHNAYELVNRRLNGLNALESKLAPDLVASLRRKYTWLYDQLNFRILAQQYGHKNASEIYSNGLPKF